MRPGSGAGPGGVEGREAGADGECADGAGTEDVGGGKPGAEAGVDADAVGAAGVGGWRPELLACRAQAVPV
jgi:hypothetical protein